MVAAQLAALAEDLPPAALKTGMLADVTLARLVGKAIRQYGWSPLVVDPVMVSTSGHRLLTPEAEDVVRESLLPLAALVTPNLDEAAILTGRAVHDEASMARAGETLLSYGAGAASGERWPPRGRRDHRPARYARGDPRLPPARDSRRPPPTAPGARCRPRSPRGSRWGETWRHRVADALDYVHRAIAAAPELGGGHGPLDHTVPPVIPSVARDLAGADKIPRYARDDRVSWDDSRPTTPSTSRSRSPATRARHLDHLGVAQPLPGDPGGRIGDRREGEAAHASRPRGDHLDRGGHPHRVRTHPLRHPYLRRCLVARPEQLEIDPLLERDPPLPRHLASQRPQRARRRGPTCRGSALRRAGPARSADSGR